MHGGCRDVFFCFVEMGCKSAKGGVKQPKYKLNRAFSVMHPPVHKGTKVQRLLGFQHMV